MTKKDYEKAAAIVRDYRAEGMVSAKNADLIRFEIGNAFVRLFKDNPRFDEDRFLRACELP